MLTIKLSNLLKDIPVADEWNDITIESTTAATLCFRGELLVPEVMSYPHV